MMGKDCCAHDVHSSSELSKEWKRALWIALILNFAMFVVETVTSHTSGSVSLQADSLDFLGDSFNYAISLYVVGHTLKNRAKVSLLKGITMMSFGLYVLIETVLKVMHQELPAPPTMGIVGTIALAVNFGVALILYRYREGDSNMQSVWLCTRNDAIGNVLVIAAAGLVYYFNTGWPDWIVGFILAALSFTAGFSVIRMARSELASSQ